MTKDLMENWVGRYYGTSRGPAWLKHSERGGVLHEMKGKEQAKGLGILEPQVCM